MNQKPTYVFPSKNTINPIYFFLFLILVLQSCQDSKSTTSSNKETKKPFSTFLANEDYWKERVVLAQTFQKERARLGKRFKPELLKLVKGNKERCYWLSSFLHSPSYLGEYKPNLDLALELLEIGLNIKLEDQRSNICDNYSMLVCCTVISEEQNDRKKAIVYSQRYLKLAKDNPGMTLGCWPAQSKEGTELLKEIEKIAKEQ